MALLPNVFVPEEAESMEFEVLPAGWYPAEIVKSDLKTTKDKTGKYIALKFKITDDVEIKGEEVKSNGRFVFTNLNIVNKNETAVKIAMSDLKAICESIGYEGELEDTVDIHDQEMMIKLSVKPETSEWPAKNEVKGYKAIE
ncbi:hypothetical protein S1R3Y_000026 [Vibrio phage vB_ValP_VA-RY-3]|nr:hypothetical protein S1R3Y_000026 [Vibrio phage vB_ValP_VA-RY-3]